MLAKRHTQRHTRGCKRYIFQAICHQAQGKYNSHTHNRTQTKTHRNKQYGHMHSQSHSETNGQRHNRRPKLATGTHKDTPVAMVTQTH